MHDERSPADAEAEADATVLDLLTETARLWSLAELGRAVGDNLTATDAVARLHAAGLAHRLGDFVFSSRAAERATQLRR
jgi:hypothetical protein